MFRDKIHADTVEAIFSRPLALKFRFSEKSQVRMIGQVNWDMPHIPVKTILGGGSCFTICFMYGIEGLSAERYGRGRLAQLGERLVYTQEVGGSSPSPPIVGMSAQTFVASRRTVAACPVWVQGELTARTRVEAKTSSRHRGCHECR